VLEENGWNIRSARYREALADDKFAFVAHNMLANLE
jgi:hypothetical protein